MNLNMARARFLALANLKLFVSATNLAWTKGTLYSSGLNYRLRSARDGSFVLDVCAIVNPLPRHSTGKCT